ncbi:MAG: alpha-ketoglutarate-dependent dioxygenase AlkB family protein [Flavobacterium sp.]
MKQLFDDTPVIWKVPNAEIIYYQHFYEDSIAKDIFETLLNETPWRQDPIKVFGKTYPQPRLTALYGDQNLKYGYSGIKMSPLPWTKTLWDIKEKIETLTPVKFTTVLLNLYRDGKDSNGWHADNEKELGLNPCIASLSLGQSRVFRLKHNTIKDEKLNIELQHGSLLLMGGTTQHFWKHQIAKTAQPMKPRINLTFRVVIPTS